MSAARPEVANVIAFLRDSLTAAQLLHAIEQDDLNPNVFTVAAYDDDYVNSGIVGWDAAKEQVLYLCHDPARDSHNTAEGVADEDNRCWWSAGSAAMMLMHLKGEVREIVAKHQAIERAAEKELDTDS